MNARTAGALPTERAAVTSLSTRYISVRRASEALCASLLPEDHVVQSMADASPLKWHLAHTTWFFETFVLAKVLAAHRLYHPQYGLLFNSYYEVVGDRFERPKRGVLSRPSVAEVHAYRGAIDAAMLELLNGTLSAETTSAIVLGLHHEQQHQELILTDIQHAFASNPLRPTYAQAKCAAAPAEKCAALSWRTYNEELAWTGHDGDGFAFDNEMPRHRTFLNPFELGMRLVTCAEYAEFIADGGYSRPDLWLSDGWAVKNALSWSAPLYWETQDDSYTHMTLSGMRGVQPAAPVCHVSFYEADAYAHWAGGRLPTEHEWEHAASGLALDGNFAESKVLHPLPARVGNTIRDPQQMFGDAWEWTASPYVPYPAFRPLDGALGEYNGKFMCNQMVLRGGSCATPSGHVRASYRNFFPPETRWQFSGIRLAKDA
jgi:ergothioneine biosynthesis protein EgtB